MVADAVRIIGIMPVMPEGPGFRIEQVQTARARPHPVAPPAVFENAVHAVAAEARRIVRIVHVAREAARRTVEPVQSPAVGPHPEMAGRGLGEAGDPVAAEAADEAAHFEDADRGKDLGDRQTGGGDDLVEKIKGSALSERAQGILAYAGWVLVGTLLIYVTFNDIVRALGGLFG
mgnify:CR=1 FL=1